MAIQRHLFVIFLLTLPLVQSCFLGNGLCSGNCSSAQEIGISGVTTRPNPDGTMDVGISGNNFEPGATVTISDVNCYNVNVSSPQYLNCTLPNQTTPITNIIITNPSGGSSGGSGGGSGGGATAFHTVFATKGDYDGNLGGLSGADSFCQTLAQAGAATSTLAGTWRAILSDDSTNAKDRISFVLGAALKNTNGATLLSSASNLWSGGNLGAAINYDQDGAQITAHSRVRTATNADGTKVTLGGDAADRSCDNWTSSQASRDSYMGDITATNSTWLFANYQSDCRGAVGSASRIYCINSNN